MSLLLALVLVFSLVACSTGGNETKAEKETKTEAGAPGETSPGAINVYTRDPSSGTNGR